jgi:hypothetical protein
MIRSSDRFSACKEMHFTVYTRHTPLELSSQHTSPLQSSSIFAKRRYDMLAFRVSQLFMALLNYQLRDVVSSRQNNLMFTVLSNTTSYTQ